MRHHITDNELLRFSTNNNAEVKDLFLSPFIGCGVATPRQFLFSPQKSDTTMQQNSQEEIWKDIPGYEGLYQASTLGGIRSYKKNVQQGANGGGICVHLYKGKLLKPRHIGNYLAVGLTKDKKQTTYLLHRIILKTFVGEPGNNEECLHLNHIHADCRLINLKWGTHKENIQMDWKEKRRVANKTMLGRRGVNSPFSKPVIQYNLQGELIRKWSSAVEIQLKTKMKASCIGKVCRKERFSAYKFKWEYETNPLEAIAMGVSVSKFKPEV